MSESEKDSDLVWSLITKPFTHCNYAEKLQLIQKGRPQPQLTSLKVEHKEKSRTYTRSFNSTNYQKYKWLTGSHTLNKLYCWPCLLFSTESGPWTSTGFNSLNYFVTACSKHQSSVSHIKAFTTLQTFGAQRINHALDLQNRASDNTHNEKVRENRAILKRLIDVVVFLGKQECPFRGRDESEVSSNNGMYVELLQFLSEYDHVLANHLKTSTVFKSTSPSIQNDLIDSVASVIYDQIKQEVSETPFVAILLDETTDVSNTSQLSSVIRFVNKHGVCQERFLYFKDVSRDRSAEGLFKMVKEIISELNCSEKLVADTFDGAAVVAEHISGLQTLLKKEYPMTTFIPCYAHRLNVVLSKCTMHIKACQRFFSTLQGISSFFSHSTSKRLALKTFVDKQLPGVAPTRWNFTSRLVNTVKDYRSHLIDFLFSIEEDPGEWTSEEVIKAIGFIRFLKKVETKFLLNVFSDIFLFSDTLFEILQCMSLDVSYCTQKVNGFHDFLQKRRNSGFQKVWQDSLVVDEHEGLGEMPSLRNKDATSEEQNHSKLYFEILDTLMYQIKFRFESQSQIKFTQLMNPSSFKEFRERFPEELTLNLKTIYPKHFDLARLRNELKVFYCQDECQQKSLKDLSVFMKTNNLDVVYEEVYKLAQLILTFPSTTASSERNFSALQRIKDYLKSTQSQSRLSNLAIVSIENDLLVDMKKTPEEFYSKVTENFTKKGKRLEFMYK